PTEIPPLSLHDALPIFEAARGPVPSLAKAIAGEPIRGSWWAHPKSREIFRAVRAVSESPDVLVCKLINDKVTYVHRRVWPALIKDRKSTRLNSSHVSIS